MLHLVDISCKDLCIGCSRTVRPSDPCKVKTCMVCMLLCITHAGSPPRCCTFPLPYCPGPPPNFDGSVVYEVLRVTAKFLRGDSKVYTV